MHERVSAKLIFVAPVIVKICPFVAFLKFKKVPGGGALVLWLWEESHVLKVVGSNPVTVYWMDILHKYLLKNCNDVC